MTRPAGPARTERSPSRGGGVLGTLFSYEMRMLLRDKRTLMVSVVLPLAIWPFLIFSMTWVESRGQERLERTTLRWAVTGSEAEYARSLVREALERSESRADSGETVLDFQEEADPAGVPDSLLRAGDLHVVVEGLTPGEWTARRDSVDAEEPVSEVPVLRLHYRDNSRFSSRAVRRIRSGLQELRADRRARLLAARGFTVHPDSVAPVEIRSTATAREEAGALLGLGLTPFIVMLMLTGGSIVAVDAISGEKERGTLETLLTTAARRWEIVGAKQLAIVVVGLAITVINVANLLVYLVLGFFELPEALAGASVTPLGLVVLFFLFVPLAVLISSVLLLLSGYAKSYKEYQIYFFPLFLLFLLPSAAALLPGIELRSFVAVVPVAGVSVAVKEVLTGQYDWVFLALTLATTGAVAAWLAGLTIRSLSTERLITASELDRADLEGGPALFPRRVLRWFGVMWVLLVVSSLWVGDGLGIRGQVTLNILGIFLGGSLLMMWRYRLDPREALALRWPRPAVWPAVLIGAPSGLLAGQGVFEMARFIFPVPDRMIEAFGQFLLPETLPLWQVVLFLCVLPGVVEEIAFRGVLLHGLRRKLGPVGLCLAVGAIFGLFHVSLFRLIPTAYLGVIFAAVVLMTGSIFPVMLWHALNNASALVPGAMGWFEGPPPEWAVPLGFAGLALSLWIIWRNRTPYPGVGEAGRPTAGSGSGG